MRETELGFPVKDCFREAINSGTKYPIFAMHDNKCYTSTKADSYKSKGSSKACFCKKGGTSAISVFEIESDAQPEFESVGCWKDGHHRALPELVLTPDYNSKMVTPTQCYDAIRKKGSNFSHFGIQVSQLCSQYKKYVRKNYISGWEGMLGFK